MTDFDGWGLELLIVGATASGEDVRDFKDLKRNRRQKHTPESIKQMHLQRGIKQRGKGMW